MLAEYHHGRLRVASDPTVAHAGDGYDVRSKMSEPFARYTDNGEEALSDLPATCSHRENHLLEKVKIRLETDAPKMRGQVPISSLTSWVLTG